MAHPRVQNIHEQTGMTVHPLLRNHLPQRAEGGAGKKNDWYQKAGDAPAAPQEPTWTGSVSQSREPLTSTTVSRISQHPTVLHPKQNISAVGASLEAFPHGERAGPRANDTRFSFYACITQKFLLKLLIFSVALTSGFSP